ncbi:MAG: CARDB domain-containing protein, partial [Candidatus Cloacimonadaceae bacterium]|nr:CARDB domain-containing protein [Candidatus Cloacimonadaceae bacterium]
STSIAIAPSGEVYIGFVSDSDPPGIFWARNGSGSWVRSFIDYGKQLGLVVDSNSYPRIVYKPDKKISVVYAEFDGLEWRGFPIFKHIYLPHANQISYYPALAIDSSDAVHILYVHLWHISILDVSGWIGELDYVKYDGLTWEESNSIQVNDDGFSFISSIALDSYGFPRVSYNTANRKGQLRFAYFVTPALTGRWSGFTLKNKNDVYSLKGSFRILNSGDGYAENVRVNFFLSDKMSLSSDDIHIGQNRVVSDLKPGGRRNIKFLWNTAENPSGKYILAVIDPDSLNLERSKADNVVYQLIP